MARLWREAGKDMFFIYSEVETSPQPGVCDVTGVSFTWYKASKVVGTLHGRDV